MNRARNEIVASIARAKIELEDALDDLKNLPALDPMVFGFVTHALANYLQVATGITGLLGRALKDHPGKEIGVWLNGLREVTIRMGNLVDELRARPRTSVPQLNFEKIDLPLLVSRACDFYRRPAARKQIEIIYEKPKPAFPSVRTDRIAVAAILDNLLSNAIKFSEPGKRVWVEVNAGTESVICRVRDEGPGIRRDDRKKLFQRARQAKPARGELSTGFGLVVASELVAHLGGSIGCESSSHGACFFFQLPTSRARTHAG